MFNNNQIFAAPLAGITDLPFRKIIRMFSADACLVTEMISCHSIVGGHKNCLRNFDEYTNEGNIGAQIFGADANLMGEAAKILENQGARWIDINMGCPVPKVATKAGAGAFLMRDHILAGKIVNAVRRAVSIPVSIKTRLGWDEENQDWRNLITVAADNGADFAALHGRTRAQLYVGPARLPEIKELPIPVIANGDIKTSDDFNRVLNLGYCGAMIGRGIMGRPWVLSEITGNKNAVPDNVGHIVLTHLEYALQYYGAKTAIPMFRKHAAWYSAGLPSATDFRIKINQITDVNALKIAISEFWGCECDI